MPDLVSDSPSRCPVPHGASLPKEAERRRTVVVTGASRGIGHAIVKRFAEDGWRIITCSRQPFDAVRCPWDAGPEDHVEIDLADRQKLLSAIETPTDLLDGVSMAVRSMPWSTMPGRPRKASRANG